MGNSVGDSMEDFTLVLSTEEKRVCLRETNKKIKEEEITCVNKNRKYKIYVSNYAMEFNEIEFLCYQKM